MPFPSAATDLHSYSAVSHASRAARLTDTAAEEALPLVHLSQLGSRAAVLNACTATVRLLGVDVAGEIDPTGGRKKALDAFLESKLQEGFKVETHTDTHAIVVAKKSFLSRFRARGADRYVVSVDENGEVTMITAEPKRS